jgi:hypothetical protein
MNLDRFKTKNNNDVCLRGSTTHQKGTFKKNGAHFFKNNYVPLFHENGKKEKRQIQQRQRHVALNTR